MIPVIKKFEYPKLERVTHENGSRYYVDPDGAHLSSVTTILSATEDKTGLNEWRAWIGEKKADQIRDEASSLGSLMHTHLENYIEGIDRPKGTNLIRKMAHNMADVIIDNGLCNVSEVWAMEEMLYYPGLFAGTTDVVVVHNGVPCILDYKSTMKPKSRDKIGNYLAQLSAYAMAHNKMHGTNIQKGVIFMVARDLTYQEFVIEGDDFKNATNDWLNRLDMFFQTNSNC